ncbi:hypothetical protein GFL95_17045 [Rhizobium leguminosarum bv. viciae]|uniref:hypothetical protein n=1 Tax=Rhizobium leguminosarum TaxID=384 RepID=UPI0014413AE3|nr:hypothetical protein [Rhizobium leguminosarum]NKK92920.1 hypothetical protein [Rhizobium leguminosarum bv. viciae]
MRETNANAREDDTSLPGAGGGSGGSTPIVEEEIAAGSASSVAKPAAPQAQSEPFEVIAASEDGKENTVRSEVFELTTPLSAPGSGWRKLFFWVTILILAAALSMFSFATGYPDPKATESAQLSIWHNAPNFSFLIIFFLIAACLALTAFSRDFLSAWTNLRGVLESGVFYFFAGLALLLYAKQGTDAAEHPSITFILAMLGIAIMLFGTGSQAAGAIATGGGTLAKLPSIPPKDGEVVAAEETPSSTTTTGDWSPVKANAVIAGGAAVLAAVFGVGVILFSDRIPGVFEDYGGYNKVMIRPCIAAGSGACTDQDIHSFSISKNMSLADYSIRAESAYGNQLFIRKENKTIQILGFKDDIRGSKYISLKFDRIGPAPPGTVDSVEVDVPTALPPDSTPDGCATSSGGVTTRCRLFKTDSNFGNHIDKISLATFILDLSVDKKPEGISVDAGSYDPKSNSVKPLKLDLQ